MYGATRTHLSVYLNWENGKWGEFDKTLKWKGFVDSIFCTPHHTYIAAGKDLYTLYDDDDNNFLL